VTIIVEDPFGIEAGLSPETPSPATKEMLSDFMAALNADRQKAEREGRLKAWQEAMVRNGILRGEGDAPEGSN
jgi:hypothetical protein